MLRRSISTALLSGPLLCGSLVLAPSSSPLSAKAVGEFATVTAVDARRGIATLQTQGGETFTVTKDRSWTVGTRVLCERVSDGTPHAMERCLHWQ